MTDLRDALELQPRDSATLIGAIAILTAIAMATGAVPAWRASRIDPARALRDS